MKRDNSVKDVTNMDLIPVLEAQGWECLDVAPKAIVKGKKDKITAEAEVLPPQEDVLPADEITHEGEL